MTNKFDVPSSARRIERLDLRGTPSRPGQIGRFENARLQAQNRGRVGRTAEMCRMHVEMTSDKMAPSGHLTLNQQIVYGSSLRRSWSIVIVLLSGGMAR